MTELPYMRAIVLRPEFIPITGDLASATVLSIALFRQQKVGEGVRWGMTRTEWRDAVYIQRKALERARKVLRDLGLLVESVKPGPGLGEVEYLVDLPALARALRGSGLGSVDTQVQLEPRDGSALGTDDTQGRTEPSTRDGSALALGTDRPYPYKEVENRERESTPGARPRVAQAVPESGGPDPLPEHAEALVGQLVETLAARRQEYGKSSVKADTMAAAVAVTAKVFGPSLRSLAREHAEAWPHVAPLFVAGGPKAPTLHKGHSPTDLRMLQTLLDGWTPDQVQAAQGGRGNGKNRERVPDAPIEYAKPADFPYWRKDFKPTREQIAAGMGMTLAEFEAAEAAGAAS